MLDGKRVWRRVLWVSIFALVVFAVGCNSLVRTVVQMSSVPPLWVATCIADGVFVIFVSAFTLITAWPARTLSFADSDHLRVVFFSNDARYSIGSLFGEMFKQRFVRTLGSERAYKLRRRLLVIACMTTLVGMLTAATMIFGAGAEGYFHTKEPVLNSPGITCGLLIVYGGHAVWAAKRIEILRFAASLPDVKDAN